MSRGIIKCNELSFNVGNLMTLLRDYYNGALAEASEKLLGLMRNEVSKTIGGDGPGKPEWRAMVVKKLKVVHEDITTNYLETGVGVPDDLLLTDLIKTMVVAYGAGSAAGNDPIMAGPLGRKVWDGNIDEQKDSEVAVSYQLPEEFNQEGNHFIENSIKLMKKHFDDVLQDAARNLPDWYFYKNVIVRER